jgi:hypothetical protein
MIFTDRVGRSCADMGAAAVAVRIVAAKASVASILM